MTVRKRIAKWLTLFIAITIVPPLCFYGWHEVQSRRVAAHEKLRPGSANALKHAEAASDLYAILRAVGISPQAAEEAVVRLGLLNEWGETYVKRGATDTSLEMMRDLHNNMVGISAARWREQDDARAQRQALLVDLARLNVLLVSQEAVDLPADLHKRAAASRDLSLAVLWFNQNRAGIAKRVFETLDAN